MKRNNLVQIGGVIAAIVVIALIFVYFSKLGNDGNTLQFLASQLQCLGNRRFILELNVADARRAVSMLVWVVVKQVLTPWTGQ